MKQSERYFRQVKRHIPIGGLRKKEFLCNLQESLAAYAAKNPSALLSDYFIMRTLENPRTLPCRFFPKCHTQK